MIRINVIYHGKMIEKVIISGHALYDDYGKDIVCASVSSTYLCTVNAIISLNEGSINISKNDEKQVISVVDSDDVIQVLLLNMIRCFESLEKQYPTNIKLDKEEK